MRPVHRGVMRKRRMKSRTRVRRKTKRFMKIRKASGPVSGIEERFILLTIEVLAWGLPKVRVGWGRDAHRGSAPCRVG